MSLRKIAFGGTLLVVMLMLAGCDDDNSKTNTYSSSGPALEIKTPSITITGVLQDKNGDPIANHKLFIGEQSDATNDVGIFTFTNVKVMSGVDVETTNQDESLLDTVGGGRKVHVVIPSVKDANGTVLNLGATAVVDVDKYLTGIYESVDQTYFLSLDGHTVYAGVIQLPQLGAKVTARLEDNVTEAPVGGTAYLMVTNQTIGGTSGVEFGNTDVNYSAVSYVERIFTADVNSSDGMFTVTGLPFNTSMDIVVSGYEKAVNAFTTYDDSVVKYQNADIKLTPILTGDNGALEFSSMIGAVGDGNYTIVLNDLIGAGTSLTGAVKNFIAPATTITLNFREAIDTTKIDAGSIKYVRTLSAEQLNTIDDINTLLDTNNTNQKNLLVLLDSFVAADTALQAYLNQNTVINSGTDTTFAGLYSTYTTRLNAMIADANTTSGGDLLNGYSYFVEANATATVNLASTAIDPLGVNPLGLITQAQTSTGVALADRRTYLATLQGTDSYDNQTVSSVVTSGTDSVVITLAATLPSNNVVQIGLVTFDFVDLAGNLLTTTRTGSVNLALDNSTSYVTQVAVGTAE